MTESEKPMSNEVLQVHLNYLRTEQHSTRTDIQKVLAAMSEMATKSDLEKLSSKFVTTDRFDALEKKVDSGTIGSTFSRAMLIIQRIAVTSAAIVALVGMLVAVVHYFDRLKEVM